MTTLREIEASLRSQGMSATDAKRTANQHFADWLVLNSAIGTQAMTTILARALDRFAPRYRYLADRAIGEAPIAVLRQARAAIQEGLDPNDAKDWNNRLAPAKGAIEELDTMITNTQTRQTEAARGARPVAGQDPVTVGSVWGGAPAFRNVNTGAMLRTYRASEPIASAGGQPDYGVGDMVRAACTGDWSRLPSHIRAGSAGVGASGGFLIPSELSGHVVDLARAQARTLQAGAVTLPMDHGNLSIAVVTGDPQAAWRAENAAFAASQGSYGRLELTTKVLGVIVPLSLELVMSAANINELVTGQLTQRLGLQLDAAAISGDGTQDQPRGILSNIPTGNVVTVGAALSTANAYASFGSAIGKCLAANAELDRLSVLVNSDVDTALDSLVDAQGQPLRPTPNFASIREGGRHFIANGIATGGSPKATYGIVGDFSQLLYGMQQSLMIEVSREGSYSDGKGGTINAFSQGQVLVRAMIACDVAVLRQNFFAEVADIRIP